MASPAEWLVPMSRALLVISMVPPMVLSALFNLYFRLFFIFAVVATTYVRDQLIVTPRAPAVWEDGWSDQVVQAVAKVIVAPLRALYIVDRYIFAKNPEVYWYYGVPLCRRQGFFDYLEMVKVRRQVSQPIRFVDHTEANDADEGDNASIVLSLSDGRRARIFSGFTSKS